MNSTHGPFFQQKGNNLPPLSAMNKYEKSTKVSDIDATLDVSLTKRAATNMEIRTDKDLEDKMVKTTAKTRSDPFYSQEMVKLADEAKQQLDIINNNKIQLQAPQLDDLGETPFT